MRKYLAKYLWLSFIPIVVCILYIIGLKKYPVGGYDMDYKSAIIKVIDPKGSFATAGIKLGDKLISIDGNVGIYQPHWLESGIPVNVVIERNEEVLTYIVKFNSFWDEDELFYIFYHSLIFLVVFAGIFVLLRRPEDASAKIFYFFCIVFATCLHSRHFVQSYMIIAGTLQTLSYPLFSTLFFHFLTIFPYRHEMDRKFNWMRIVMYVGGIFFGLLISILYLNFMLNRTPENNILRDSARIAANYWMGISILFAVIYGFIKYIRIKDSYSKNQFRWIMIGFFFGMLLPMVWGISQSITQGFLTQIPNLLLYINGVGVPIMLICFLFAVMKYKVWDIEIIIKKGLLYSGITFSVIGIYFLFIYLVESFLNESSETAKVVGLSAAALSFIPVRERIQKRVDKIFYREKVDPAEAILQFENNLLGIYEKEKLYPAILNEVNKIFHLDNCAIFLLTSKNVFVEVHSYSEKSINNLDKIIINDELAEKLGNGKPVALNELKNKIELNQSEILTPLLDEKNISGFLSCGRKKSHKIFTLQDMNILQLIAQRIVSLIKISNLYRNELERQLSLEKERARISRDMHDEIGANLTRISLLSSVSVSNKEEENISALNQITDSVNETIVKLDEIVWAINPSNDNLKNLTSYILEYAQNFFESSEIKCRFNLPEIIPEISLTSEKRHHLFLTIKEALNNVQKYSKANRVIISLSVKPLFFKFTIKDDGKGFCPEVVSITSNGIKNMRERISSVGGEFELVSKIGEGTEISLTVSA